MMFCMVYRWQISNTFDNASQLPPGCRRHLMRCDRCRSFFTSSLVLSERLALEAAMAQPAVPSRLGERISMAIGPGIRTGSLRPHWRLIAAASAAAVLLPVLFLISSYVQTEKPDNLDLPSQASMQALLGANGIAVEQFAESVDGLLERPLAAEVQALQRQTRSAFEFLMSCSGADMAIRRQAL